jgi:hypothetical protein
MIHVFRHWVNPITLFVTTLSKTKVTQHPIPPFTNKLHSASCKKKVEAGSFLPKYNKYFSRKTNRRTISAKKCKQITMFRSNINSDNKRGCPSPGEPYAVKVAHTALWGT